MQASFLPHVRRSLLELHKALVDAERRGHEKTLGRLPDGEFLDALIKDPAFAWLSPLTALIARLDEEQAPRGEALARVVRSLLSPQAPTLEFHRRYADFLQRDPDIVVAHGAVMRALRG